MNNNKFIARIIAGFLVTITLLGMIVPYVMAAEIESNTSETEATERNPEDFQIELPEDVLAILDGAESENNGDSANITHEEVSGAIGETVSNKPEKGLPQGFEYVDIGGIWTVKKTEDNTQPAIIVDGLPIGFDSRVITVFIGNLRTREVVYYDVYDFNSYVSSVSLKDGYYVVFANGYAWSDAEGNAYAINGGEYQYIYIGDDYDDSIYGVDFEQANEPISISLGTAPEGMKVVEYNGSILVDNDDLVYPEGAKLANVEEMEATLPQEEIEQADEKEDPFAKIEKPSIGKIFLDFLDRSWLLLMALAGCYIGLIVVRRKNQEKAEDRFEKDRYDDKYID